MLRRWNSFFLSQNENSIKSSICDAFWKLNMHRFGKHYIIQFYDYLAAFPFRDLFMFYQ